MPFDRNDVSRELSENRRLVARARANFQQMIRRVDTQELGHPSHDKRLRDRLPFGDAERVIAIRDVKIFVANEALTWHLRHRRKHTLVANTHATEFADHLIAIGQKIH